MLRIAMMVLAMALALGLGAAAGEGDCGSYPERTVEATVQWAPGGGADQVFRILASVFPRHANGQELVVRNVPGNAGVNGCVEFLSAPADGYHLLHWSNAHLVKAHMSVVPYGADSFVPVIQIVDNPNFLLVRADAPWKTLDEFLVHARSNPGDVTIGNAGVGGGNHLSALLFAESTGLDCLHVPFSGGSGAVAGLLAGQVDAVMANATEGYDEIAAGEARVLVGFGGQRLPAYPDVPTAREEGYDLEINQWRGVAVPKGTSEALVARIHDIVRRCVEDEEYATRIREMNAEPAYRDTAAFAAFVAEEDRRFENIIRTLGFGERYSK